MLNIAYIQRGMLSTMAIVMENGTNNLSGGARGVMVIVVGNGYGNTSSNPGRD